MNLKDYLLSFKSKWNNQKFPLFNKKEIKQMIKKKD